MKTRLCVLRSFEVSILFLTVNMISILAKLLSDFGSSGIIYMVCVITIAIVMLLRDFEPYGIIFLIIYLML